jgi:hypothetical protein
MKLPYYILLSITVSLHCLANDPSGSELEDLKTLNELDNSHLEFDFFSESNDNTWNESREALELLESFEQHQNEEDFEQEIDQQDAIEEELEEEIEQEFEPDIIEDDVEDDIEDEEDIEDEQELEEPEDEE